MAIAFALFALSITGIASLVALKQWEARTGHTVAPELRARADASALRVKELGLALQKDAEKLPPEALHLSKVGLHHAAKGAAKSLRFLEGKAHQVADLVSHKHRFERRAPRSEFLKKVSERKDTDEQPVALDGETSNGQNG